MKTISINLYSYDELSDKAKERALRDWNEYNDDPFMQSHMINLLKEELDARGVKYDVDSIDVRYSLSHCQGDGFMFMGRIEWRGETVTVTHNDHHYCHMFTAGIETGKLQSKDVDSFKAMYEEVCKEMESKGYAHIEWITSAENFRETCEANEYTFEENGKMRNA